MLLRTKSKGPVSQLVNAKVYISRQCTSIFKAWVDIQYCTVGLNCHCHRFRNVGKLPRFSLVHDIRDFRR